MPTAIKIENLSKQYRLGLVGTGTLSHDLKRWWTINILGKEDPYLKIGEINDRAAKSKSDYVWALKDINLEIKQGEVLGIIGKNGAGKSTLLKILSRVTKPSTGNIYYNGRIASLLEVGTGFHPEMTGRENIFMNGSIMGMNKKEINRKLDEIIDFAGIERYIDTPVKRYSSGMTVRLGFSIAAHLEPDILVVDEVLAVGDAEFQKKAIGKMQDVSKGNGRTVLFVSHNMAAVKDLCNHSVLLENGQVFKTGLTQNVIEYYLHQSKTTVTSQQWKDINIAPGDKDIKIRQLKIINENRQTLTFVNINQTFGIYIEYEVLNEIPYFLLGMNLFNIAGVHIFTTHDNNKYLSGTNVKKGLYSTVIWIPSNLLQDGDYMISVAAMRYNPFEILFHVYELLRIHIIDSMHSETRNIDYNRNLPGLIRPKLNWEKTKYHK